MQIKKLYFSSEGRICRKSFILGSLGLILVYFFIVFLLAMMINPYENIFFIIFFFILMIVSAFANINLHIKRFHDINMSGWWTLLILLPYINLLVFLIIAFIPGTKGKNRFGDNPVEVKEEVYKKKEIDNI